MKKIVLFFSLIVIVKTYGQIGTNPVYAPSIIVPQTETHYSESVNYLIGWLDIIIKDENYYKRQDRIAQSEFDNNMITIKKAVDYYEKGDYESAIYYGKDIRYTEYYEINNIKHLIVTTSYFQVNDIGNSKKWYAISKKRVDPETMRKIDSSISSTGMKDKIIANDQAKLDEKKQRKHRRNKRALITGVILTIGIPLIILGALILQ